MIRRIDSHVHLYPPEINADPAGWAEASGERHWQALALRLRRDGTAVQTFPSVGQLLKAMDAAGVEGAVLLGWYWWRHDSCVAQNRFYAECLRAHPDRLRAFATFHPAAGEKAVAAEMAWARDSGFSGLGELSPHAQFYDQKEAVFRGAIARAGEWGWPVNFHVTDGNARPYPGRIETPAEDFVRLARAFPATSFILAHWGGLLPLRIPAAAALRNLYYDTAASPLSYDRGIWGRMAGAAGADRILYGSDYPLNLYPALGLEPEMSRLVAEAKGSGLAGSDLNAIFSGNLERLL